MENDQSVRNQDMAEHLWMTRPAADEVEINTMQRRRRRRIQAW